MPRHCGADRAFFKSNLAEAAQQVLEPRTQSGYIRESSGTKPWIAMMVKPRPMYRKNGLLMAEMARNGYTITTLAKATGVHYLTIWRIVNQEHNPNLATANRISEVLDSTPQALGLTVWGTGESKKKDVR